MQHQDQNNRAAGTLDHPDAAEWMAFLYGETASARSRELRAHLAQCPACAGQLKAWRASVSALDAWALPAPRRAARPWLPILKWATAAALVLGLGFAVGRQTAPAATEIAALNESVAQLAAAAQREREESAHQAANAAAAEVTRLLSEYSRVQYEQRTADQQQARLALHALDAQVAKLQNELETVALNTESGFRATGQSLTRLASYSLPAAGSPPLNSTPGQFLNQR